MLFYILLLAIGAVLCAPTIQQAVIEPDNSNTPPNALRHPHLGLPITSTLNQTNTRTTTSTNSTVRTVTVNGTEFASLSSAPNTTTTSPPDGQTSPISAGNHTTNGNPDQQASLMHQLH